VRHRRSCEHEEEWGAGGERRRMGERFIAATATATAAAAAAAAAVEGIE